MEKVYAKIYFSYMCFLTSPLVKMWIYITQQRICRPALTAVWSKAPPLTAHCLSPLPGFEFRPGRKAPVTWG